MLRWYGLLLESTKDHREIYGMLLRVRIEQVIDVQRLQFVHGRRRSHMLSPKCSLRGDLTICVMIGCRVEGTLDEMLDSWLGILA